MAFCTSIAVLVDILKETEALSALIILQCMVPPLSVYFRGQGHVAPNKNLQNIQDVKAI